MRRKHWSEPGTGTWFWRVTLAIVVALALYFILRLGTALWHRFGAIGRAYDVPETVLPSSGNRG